MRALQSSVVGLTAALALGSASPVAAQPHDHGGHEHAVLGEVAFPVTCSPSAQALFNEGMKLQHSFWYAPARQAFRKTVEADPACGTPAGPARTRTSAAASCLR